MQSTKELVQGLTFPEPTFQGTGVFIPGPLSEETLQAIHQRMGQSGRSEEEWRQDVGLLWAEISRLRAAKQT